MQVTSDEQVFIKLDTSLLITFIVLKLCGVISWSWWWVLSPLWIPPAAAACLVLVLAAGGLFICGCLLAWGWMTAKRGK